MNEEAVVLGKGVWYRVNYVWCGDERHDSDKPKGLPINADMPGDIHSICLFTSDGYDHDGSFPIRPMAEIDLSEIALNTMDATGEKDDAYQLIKQ